MAALLTCLLSMFSLNVNAYNKSTIKPMRVPSDLSGTEDGDIGHASCPESNPTLVACGQDYESGDARIFGSYPLNGECVAQNGENSTSGVQANALCVSNDYTCTYHTGSLSYGTSTVGCTDEDEIMVSCSPHTDSNSIHGSYVGTQYESTAIDSSTLCTAHSEMNALFGTPVSAEGICCTYHDNDGYQLDCKTKWGGTSSGKSYAKCLESGYMLWGCSGYSWYKDSLASYKSNPGGNTCVVRSVLHPVQAVATCCRLYKEPTPLPTDSPTPNPTSSPTIPTSSPTKVPTVNPIDPTSNPSTDPSVHPSTDPTPHPSIDPTYAPSYEPSATPTIEPTTDNPSNAPASDPLMTPTHEEYDVVTASFEFTSYEHRSGARKSTNSLNWSDVLYIVIGVCIGCIIYGCIVRAKRRLGTDTNPRAPSLGETHPPSIGTVSVPGAQKTIVPVCKDDDDDDGSDSSHGLYDVRDSYRTPTVGEMATPGSVEGGEKSIVFDSIVVDIALINKDEDGSESASSNIESLLDHEDPYQTPTVDDKRMTSLPLPELPREASRTPSLPHMASRMSSLPLPGLSDDDEGNDSDDLYEQDMPK